MRYLLLISILFATQLQGQEIRYTQADSIKICKMLSQLNRLKEKKPSELFIAAGRLFLGTPYVGGTLDKEKEEKLTVNVSEVDCTTFVEQALALTTTIKKGKKDFKSFCDALLEIRYRDGKCRSYADRLHYFSQLVANGEKNGIFKEINGKEFSARQMLNLTFMSSNPDKYMQLRGDSTLTLSIARWEEPFRDKAIPYLPKSKLNKNRRELPVRDGDIIALVTGINGLDVTHIGIACWKNKKLHMIHASYKEKKVIFDQTPLYDYLAPRKSAPGIRVIRLK